MNGHQDDFQVKNKQEFVNMFSQQTDIREAVESISDAKYTFIGMLGLSDTGDIEEQKKAIMSIMEQTDEINLEKYIDDHL